MDAAKAIPGPASNPIEIVDVEPVVVQSPPLPIPPTVVSVVETNAEEAVATVESNPVLVEMQDEGSTSLEGVVVDGVNNDECEDPSESSDVPNPIGVLALQDDEIIFTLETDVEETVATVESTPVAVETQDEASALLKEVEVDDVNDDGCDDLILAQSSALNSIEIVDVEQVVVQSPPLPILPAAALGTNAEETVAAVASAPTAVETHDEGSTSLEAVAVDYVNDDGCDDLVLAQSWALNLDIVDVEPEVVQSPHLPIIPSALDANVEKTVEYVPVAADECSIFMEEVDVDDVNDDGCEDLSESPGVPEPVELPVESLVLQDDEIEDISLLAPAVELPKEKTPEEAVVNEDIIPSVMDKVEDGEESTAIHDASTHPTIESNASPEMTTEETIQEITKETTIMGSSEGDLESNHEKPTSTNTSSILSHPIKSDESPGEDIDTTFEVTDNEEDLEDPMEETPEMSDEDAVTCNAENDNSAMSYVARLSGDQKNGYASHTSNESQEPGGSASSLSQLSADENIPMDPNLIEQGRAGGAINETKAFIPKETFWGRHKAKFALGCFLLVVLVSVVLGVVVAGSDGGASPANSLTAIAPSQSPSATSSAFDLQKFQALLPAYSQAALLDEASSQAKALAWLELNSDLELYSDFQRLQRFALATLFYATNGEEWSNNDGWVKDFPFNECDWSMDEPGSIRECVNGRHEELSLDLNGLIGTLPNELAMITDLKILQLSFNGLKGAIPSQYGLLTNLKTLSLYLNLLDGRISSELGRLTALEDIDLTRNSLTGPIPSEVLTGWSNVKMLRISGNNFSGVIPSEVGDLKNAEFIDFSDNAFEGQIPTELALLTNLESLYLHNNAGISGQIPSVLGILSQLQIITLDNTNLSGAVPRELCELMQRHFVVVEVDCSRVACDCGCTCV